MASQVWLFPADFTERRIVIKKEITCGTTEAFCRKLALLNLSGAEPIEFLVDSKGGDAEACLKIYEAIESSVAPVIGKVLSCAWSGALIALQACKERRSERNATFKIHNISRNFDVSVTVKDSIPQVVNNLRLKVEQCIGEVEALQSRVDGLFVARLGDYSKVRQLSDEGKILTAEEALKVGLIDKIV